MSDQQDNDLALIHANRDAILRVLQEGIIKAINAIDKGEPEFARRILRAANSFHPMYDFEWPKESDHA